MSSKRKKLSGMTKSQIDGMIVNIREYVQQNTTRIKDEISAKMDSDLILTDSRKSMLSDMLQLDMTEILCDRFCNLYKDCNTGYLLDRYSVFQIRWSEFIADCLDCGTHSNAAVIQKNYIFLV